MSSYKEVQFSDIPYFHRPEKEYGILSFFHISSPTDNRFEAHQNYLPFSDPWGFFPWRHLLFLNINCVSCAVAVRVSPAERGTAAGQAVPAEMMQSCHPGHHRAQIVILWTPLCTLGMAWLGIVHHLASHALRGALRFYGFFIFFRSCPALNSMWSVSKLSSHFGQTQQSLQAWEPRPASASGP